MLPIIDRPAIQYVVEEAAEVGITDVLLITGRAKRSIEDHFDRSPELEHALAASGKQTDLDDIVRIASLARIHSVRQPEAKGLGHAVGFARHHVGDEPSSSCSATTSWWATASWPAWSRPTTSTDAR